jgi:hypothetical protein
MKKSLIAIVLCAIASTFFTTQLFAHHAKEYLQTESYAQAPQGGLIMFNGFDYFVPDSDNSELDEWEYTPTFIYGITDRLMVNLHTHLLHINNEPAFFEAFAFGFQYQITKPDTWLVDVGMNVEYEIPFQKSRDLIDGRQLIASTLIISKELPHDINLTSNISYHKEESSSRPASIQSYCGIRWPFPANEISSSSSEPCFTSLW